MKTPIQELIDELTMEEKYTLVSNIEEDRAYKQGIRNAIIAATSYLESEKKVITEAWENGYNQGACVNEDKNKYHGSQYYNEKFKQNDR